jgi:hypothetical protein
MDARRKVLQRETAGQSCMNIVVKQLELPSTHPCLPIRNGERKCAVFAKQLRNKHLSGRINEEPSCSVWVPQLISKRIHNGRDQMVMLSEAVNDLDPSRVALEILCCESMKESRVNADVNRLDSASVSSVPPNFGRLARRS